MFEDACNGVRGSRDQGARTMVHGRCRPSKSGERHTSCGVGEQHVERASRLVFSFELRGVHGSEANLREDLIDAVDVTKIACQQDSKILYQKVVDRDGVCRRFALRRSRSCARQIVPVASTKELLMGTYLEKRLRIRPLGVVSKKLIGLRKIA
jgi:hypothetical protein